MIYRKDFNDHFYHWTSGVIQDCNRGPYIEVPDHAGSRGIEAWRLTFDRRCNAASSEYPCHNQLPPEYKWVGTYFPAIVDTTTNLTHAVGLSKFNCPHCAAVAANYIMLTAAEKPATWRTGFCAVYTPPACTKTAVEGIFSEYLFAMSDGPLIFTTKTIKGVDASEYARACGNCGFPGHNSRTCRADEACYDKVGIEIEGRWVEIGQTIRRAEAAGITSMEDCSVYHSNTASRREFQTVPDNLSGALRQLVNFYPDESDASCGLHVHVSFQDPTHITQLISKEFYAYFRAQWCDWAREEGLSEISSFWTRLNGKNSFCMPNRDGDVTEDVWVMDRYRQLNFTAWREHKTVECRLLPMFRSQAQACRAVIKLLEIYETWLSRDFAATLPACVVATSDMLGSTHESEFTVEIGGAEGLSSTQEFGLELQDILPVADGYQRMVPNQYQRSALIELGLIQAA